MPIPLRWIASSRVGESLACLALFVLSVSCAQAEMMKVILRYDDFSAMSNIDIDREILETVGNIRAHAIVSVVAFPRMPYPEPGAAVNDISSNISQEKVDLLKSLMSRGVIEVAVHGYNHSDNSGQGKPSEYSGMSVNRQAQLLTAAKTSLEAALGEKINIMVPPFNGYDNATLQALTKTGFRVLSAGLDGPTLENSGTAYLPAGPYPYRVRDVARAALAKGHDYPILVISVHAYDFSASGEGLPSFRKGQGKISLEDFLKELYWLKSQGAVEFTSVNRLIEEGEDLSAARLEANLLLKHSLVTVHCLLPEAFGLSPVAGLYYSKAVADRMYWSQIAAAVAFYIGVIVVSMMLTRLSMHWARGHHPLLDDLLIFSGVIIPLLGLLMIIDRSVTHGFYLLSFTIGTACLGIFLEMMHRHRSDVFGRFFGNENNIMKYLSLPLRYKLWSRRHVRLIMADLAGPTAREPQPHQAHLTAAIDWLCRAQDVRNGKPDEGGVAAGWSFEDGWLPSYPETTGYIIETFLAAAKVIDRPDLVQRAKRMIDWELSLQQANGAFPGHFGEPGSHPVIFNQGQILHGMVAGYTQLGRQDCLEAAVRGGRWMAAQQDEDGCWRRFEHNDTPHVYNTRATWALLAVGLIAGEPALVAAARRNLDWALAQQTASGWYATNAFVPWRSPFTHTIAYAIRGFLECGVLLGEQRYIDSALEAGRELARVQRRDGSLAGTYKDGWSTNVTYTCLTGIAQMSLNWTRMVQVTGDDGWRSPARAALAYLKTVQRLDDPDDAVRGGIAGSRPIWGGYSRFEYPNWAAKFFADALMMDLADIAVPPVPTVRGVSA